ncbi:MAG: DUF4010 domain-containing protein [Nautiliaceae bacterium]
MRVLNFIPQDLIYFLIVVGFSFLVGLELKTFHQNEQKTHFGSARTYTFIGMIGFVFYKINFWLYVSGFFALSFLYIIHYIFKNKTNRTSILSYLIMALVYSFGPLINLYQIWMLALIFVLIVFILNYKKYFDFENIDEKEFETLGKFLLLSGVILPILPDEPIKSLGISPFKIWLIVVIVSTISYGSYLAQKFLSKGYLLTGILGGLYSSTATSVVLAKKAVQSTKETLSIINSAIIIATSMMYIRLLVLAFIFNEKVAKQITLPMLLFATLGAIIAIFLHKKNSLNHEMMEDKNPLELGTAFIFAFLFIAMMIITKFVTSHFGNLGLKILSFIIGFTDIDPFVLSLLTGKFQLPLNAIASAIIIAAGSNNILKAIYTYTFSKKRAKVAAIWLFVLGMLTIGYGLMYN